MNYVKYFFSIIFFIFVSHSYAAGMISSICVVDSLNASTTASCDGKTAAPLERTGGDPGTENALTHFLYKKINEGYKIINVTPAGPGGGVVYTLIKN
ncbi:MAG: hypothetical protein QE271_02815 [Bacteriovoracaceae bacterium]|nr:hypothetical protein [Bacteriovoracaceae bacterium]